VQTTRRTQAPLPPQQQEMRLVDLPPLHRPPLQRPHLPPQGDEEVTLKFNERNHSYYLDGKRVPGVTGILGNGIPKPALPRWAARTVAEYVADNRHELDGWSRMGRESLVAALKQVPWTARDEAAVRGTDVHNLAEQILTTGEADVPDHLEAHV